MTHADPNPATLPDDTHTRALASELYRLTALDQLFSRVPSSRAPRFTRRQALADALWDAAEPGPVEARPLPEIDAADFTLARFLDLSDGYHRPVVIRGFAADSTAVRTWSADRLAERIGPIPITAAEVDTASAAEIAESGRTLHEMPFTDFVRRMHHEPIYLHNSSTLTNEHPELLDELDLPRLRETFGDAHSNWDSIFAAAFFIGTERVFSSVHAAPGGNFFLQVTGKKTWTLVDPAHSAWMLPLPARPFTFLRAYYPTFRDGAPTDPLNRLPRYTVTLEPGDLLFNAPWWWHEVINHGETIGCAMRNVRPPLERAPDWGNHRLWSALSVWPRLWAASLVDYGRHRINARLGRARSGTLRDFIAAHGDRQINRGRGRRPS